VSQTRTKRGEDTHTLVGIRGGIKGGVSERKQEVEKYEGVQRETIKGRLGE